MQEKVNEEVKNCITNLQLKGKVVIIMGLFLLEAHISKLLYIGMQILFIVLCLFF